MTKLRFRDINWLILGHTAGMNGRVADSDFEPKTAYLHLMSFPWLTLPLLLRCQISTLVIWENKKLIQWNCQLYVEIGAREFECNRKPENPQTSLESDISVSFPIIFQYPFQDPWRHYKEIANKWPIGFRCLSFHLMQVLRIRNLPESAAEIWEGRESVLCKIG